MYNKILVPVDGSRESIAAAALARDFINVGLAKSVVLIHVLNIAHELNDISILKPTMIHEESEKRRMDDFGQKILEPAKVLFDQNHIQVDTVVEWGDPATELIKAALAYNIDLIIMGNRGLSSIKGMLMGSVSTKTLHLAQCPVIVLKS